MLIDLDTQSLLRKTNFSFFSSNVTESLSFILNVIMAEHLERISKEANIFYKSKSHNIYFAGSYNGGATASNSMLLRVFRNLYKKVTDETFYLENVSGRNNLLEDINHRTDRLAIYPYYLSETNRIIPSYFRYLIFNDLSQILYSAFSLGSLLLDYDIASMPSVQKALMNAESEEYKELQKLYNEIIASLSEAQAYLMLKLSASTHLSGVTNISVTLDQGKISLPTQKYLPYFLLITHPLFDPESAPYSKIETIKLILGKKDINKIIKSNNEEEINDLSNLILLLARKAFSIPKEVKISFTTYTLSVFSAILDALYRKPFDFRIFVTAVYLYQNFDEIKKIPDLLNNLFKAINANYPKQTTAFKNIELRKEEIDYLVKKNLLKKIKVKYKKNNSFITLYLVTQDDREEYRTVIQELSKDYNEELGNFYKEYASSVLKDNKVYINNGTIRFAIIPSSMSLSELDRDSFYSIIKTVSPYRSFDDLGSRLPRFAVSGILGYLDLYFMDYIKLFKKLGEMPI